MKKFIYIEGTKNIVSKFHKKMPLYEIFHVSYRDAIPYAVPLYFMTIVMHSSALTCLSPITMGFRLHLHNISVFRLAAPRLVHCTLPLFHTNQQLSEFRFTVTAPLQSICFFNIVILAIIRNRYNDYI